jgi:TonB family protein
MVKASLCMGSFYLVYGLFLKNDTHFAMNRFYLLLTALLSSLIPLVSLNIDLADMPESYSYIMDTISVGSRWVERTLPDDAGTFEILMVCYSAGVAVALTGFLIRIARLLLIIRSEGYTVHDGMKIVFLPEGSGSPFSFFRYVFITREHYHSHEVQEMLMHEQVHIRQRHSADLLLMEMLAILQWFNPFIWLYRKSMKHIHEYIADEGVIRHSEDKQAYQCALLHIGTGLIASSLVNNFNHSLLKRRFIMMNRSKSLPHTRWKIMAVVPLMAFLFLVFSDVSGGYIGQAFSWGQPGWAITGSLAEEASSMDPEVVLPALSTPQGQNDSVFTKVDVAPAYKGGHEALVSFISQNIRYPEEARKQGIQGTVFVSFLIDEKGKVTNGKVMRGIGSGCDEEALRVVMAMPDWNPGKNGEKPVKVNITLPIKFTLSDKDQKKDVGVDINKDTLKDKDPE